jgi:hypothetical protein
VSAAKPSGAQAQSAGLPVDGVSEPRALLDDDPGEIADMDEPDPQ